MAESPKEENSQSEQTKPKENGTTKPLMVSIPQADFQKLEKDAEEYKDKYLRLLADMDNSRKRMQKERLELLQHSMQNIIVEFLLPIDQMENALKFADQMSADIKHWAVGFQMILNQLKDVLSNHGVIAYSSVGEAFDPHRHEAIEVIATKDHPPGTVLSESLKGYKMGDKIIRPARVRVAQSPDEDTEESKDELKNESKDK
jgi:molecular chaperone GrpE